MTDRLTHLDETGAAHMVDIGGKSETRREATAEAVVAMSAATLKLAVEGQLKKGDVFGAARIAGIMAAKQTPQLIPLCHPLPLDAVEVSFTVDEAASEITVTATAVTTARTGVEMEALTAATVGALVERIHYVARLGLGGWVGNAFPRTSSLFLVRMGAEVGSDAQYRPSCLSWVEAGLADSRYRHTLLEIATLIALLVDAGIDGESSSTSRSKSSARRGRAAD